MKIWIINGTISTFWYSCSTQVPASHLPIHSTPKKNGFLPNSVRFDSKWRTFYAYDEFPLNSDQNSQPKWIRLIRNMPYIMAESKIRSKWRQSRNFSCRSAVQTFVSFFPLVLPHGPPTNPKILFRYRNIIRLSVDDPAIEGVHSISYELKYKSAGGEWKRDFLSERLPPGGAKFTISNLGKLWSF